jgi:hypothetical protein
MFPERVQQESKLYDNYVFKIVHSNETDSKMTIRQTSYIHGEEINNIIRLKNRFSFDINKFWRTDLSITKTAYSIETLSSKPEKYEIELEYIGGKNISAELFLKSCSDIYTFIIANTNYCFNLE